MSFTKNPKLASFNTAELSMYEALVAVGVSLKFNKKSSSAQGNFLCLPLLKKAMKSAGWKRQAGGFFKESGLLYIKKRIAKGVYVGMKISFESENYLKDFSSFTIDFVQI